MYVVCCSRNVNIICWPFCLIFLLQTCIVCVFRWLIFSPSNHNSSVRRHMNNIVQYRATTCSPQFVVAYRGWQYVDSGSTLKHHIKENFCLQSSMGAKWGYQGLTVFCHGFVQASCKYIKGYFTCCLCKRKLLLIIRVGFDEMDQLLIIYFEFFRYLKKTKGIQWGSA